VSLLWWLFLLLCEETFCFCCLFFEFLLQNILHILLLWMFPLHFILSSSIILGFFWDLLKWLRLNLNSLSSYLSLWNLGIVYLDWDEFCE
jgi:hypothetical protein